MKKFGLEGGSICAMTRPETMEDVVEVDGGGEAAIYKHHHHLTYYLH